MTLPIRKIQCNSYIRRAWKCHSANGMNDETAAVETVAGLMALSARTAPKARGTDVIVTGVVIIGVVAFDRLAHGKRPE